MLTLNNVVKNLNNIADSHEQINHFFYGEVYDFASSGTVEYPAMLVTQQPNTLGKGILTMSFNIHIMDLVHKDISDRQEVVSDTQSIILDVISLLKRTHDYEWNIVLDIVLNNFVDKFDEEVTGWWFKLSLRIPNVLDRCQVPVSSEPIIKSGT